MLNRLSNHVRNMFIQELECSRTTMQWGGLIGVIAHPFYFIVWTYLIPQPYDNLYLRLSAAIICLPMAFQKYWPRHLEVYLVACWHFCLVYSLVFTCTFLAVKNSFSTMWMMTEVMVIFTMTLCIENLLILFIYMSVGLSAACLTALLGSEFPLLIQASDKANLAVLPVVTLCSMVFSNTIQQGRNRALVDKTKALITLAGSIAHEMRNPLGQMKYALESSSNLLPTPGANNDDQTISAKTVNDIYTNIAQGLNSCRRGLQVIDITLHEVSNHELNPETFEYHSAGTVTAKAIDEYGFDTPAERNRIKIQTRNDFIFKVDETACIYILFNIVKNALYYFKLYPDAEMTIEVDRQSIIITDTGPGIPEPVFSKLFREFTTSGKSNGTGLGLAYCKRTMQTFNGTISCETVVGQYTKFTLVFPLISKEEIELHTTHLLHAVAPLFLHKRILVVDDDSIYPATIRNYLNGLNCSIDVAENGEWAINLLGSSHYDLIIMDLNLPVKDGYTTAVEIRSGAVPHQKNIPIVACTGELHYMAKIKTEKIGMDGFINKQCSQLDLITVIYKTMRSVQHRLAPEKCASALAGKTILITDDELFNRQYMEIYVTQWGMKTLHADCGQTALEILENNPSVDIISMDMRMPGLSGIETVKRIRANPAYQDISIVAVTGDFFESYSADAISAGINDFISKPIDKAALHQILMRQLLAYPGIRERTHCDNT